MTSAAGITGMPDTRPRTSTAFEWSDVIDGALAHRRELVIAHVVAILAALLSVPIPLLMPLLVDEVLLERPGFAVETMQEKSFEGTYQRRDETMPGQLVMACPAASSLS